MKPSDDLAEALDRKLNPIFWVAIAVIGFVLWSLT